jgi:multidrug resistance efflux pump
VLATQQEAQASYDQAIADRGVAQLNLDRSEVHASVNGIITNMDLRPGAYVTAGHGVMALVDTERTRDLQSTEDANDQKAGQSSDVRTARGLEPS